MATFPRVYSLWIYVNGDISSQQTVGAYDLKCAVIYIFYEFNQAFKIYFLIIKLRQMTPIWT